MRCPSCGTENEPDSRFCGGCGAKLVSESRVAPTAKISDDARYPTPPPASMAPASIPPGHHTPAQSLPPRMPAPAMPTPPPGSLRGMQVPPRAQSPSPIAAASAPEMSSSLPVVSQRPVGLMVAVLIIDLALAAAGAVMLAKGLARPKSDGKPAVKESNAAAPAPGSAAIAVAAPAPAAADAGVAALAVASTQPAAPEPRAAAAAAVDAKPPEPAKQDAKDTRGAKDTKGAKDTRRSPARKSGAPASGGGAGLAQASATGPEDPYAPDLGAEIEQNAAATASEFQKCRDNAASVAPVSGVIQMAFQVLPSGAVTHIAAVQNTTDSAWLASCLAGAMTTWKFSPHAGKVLEYVRPFSYP